jgi:hypothetical protein
MYTGGEMTRGGSVMATTVVSLRSLIPEVEGASVYDNQAGRQGLSSDAKALRLLASPHGSLSGPNRRHEA